MNETTKENDMSRLEAFSTGAIGAILLCAILAVTSIGCDAQIGKLQALGSAADIKCYSGGKMIYEGKSTGKVISEENSDGYFFKDAADGKLKEVSGNCVIAYE